MIPLTSFEQRPLTNEKASDASYYAKRSINVGTLDLPYDVPDYGTRELQTAKPVMDYSISEAQVTEA